MNRIILILCLFIANLSLTSFGIISNPNAALIRTKASNALIVNSKSSIKIQQGLSKPLLDLENIEINSENQNSFLKSYFGFVYNLITKLVSAFSSK
jgi:hypothetical protein